MAQARVVSKGKSSKKARTHKRHAKTTRSKKSKKVGVKKLIGMDVKKALQVLKKGEGRFQPHVLVNGRPYRHKVRGREVATYVLIPKKTYELLRRNRKKRKARYNYVKGYQKGRDAKKKAMPPGLRLVTDPTTKKVIGAYYEYSLNRTDFGGKV